jgi:hypothetical protein
LYTLASNGVLLLDFQQTEQNAAAKELRERFRIALIDANFADSTRLETGKKPSIDVEDWMNMRPLFEATLRRFVGSAKQ